VFSTKALSEDFESTINELGNDCQMNWFSKIAVFNDTVIYLQSLIQVVWFN
jgi:hypothetical protein